MEPSILMPARLKPVGGHPTSFPSGICGQRITDISHVGNASLPNLVGTLYGQDSGRAPEPTHLAPSLPKNHSSLHRIQSQSDNGVWGGRSLHLGFIARQIYLHLLLRLPLVYLRRVVDIFEESMMSMEEVTKMAFEMAFHRSRSYLDDRSKSTLVYRYEQLDKTWNTFVDSLLRDWNIYNVVSALLSSSILTILQINDAAQDPIIRYSLLFSQVCGLISLLHGCTFSIRFDSNMRKIYKAAEWASLGRENEASQDIYCLSRSRDSRESNTWWNIWTLLAMPAIWLSWSIIFYIVAIMAFVWRTNIPGSAKPTPLTGKSLLLVRTIITAVLGLGFITGGLSLRTFRQYGRRLDQEWTRRIQTWTKAQHRQGLASDDFYNNVVLKPPSPRARSPDITRNKARSRYQEDTALNYDYPQFQFPEPRYSEQSMRSLSRPANPSGLHMTMFDSIHRPTDPVNAKFVRSASGDHEESLLTRRAVP